MYRMIDHRSGWGVVVGLGRSFQTFFSLLCGHLQGFMNAVDAPAVRTEKSFELAIFAVMVAGACTFLNVHCFHFSSVFSMPP
jgi:hypothetical protein